jgi:regulator of protease activity HflC (stomatin/prohibitin superfamily)
MLILWAIVAVVVLASALLIYTEHEWGIVLGGSTAVILVIS